MYVPGELMTFPALSVLLGLLSAVAYAGGAIGQERTARSDNGRLGALLRGPAWWAAAGMNALGALLHVLALACGPLSLVQPLGVLTIVLAPALSALGGRRPAPVALWRAVLTTALGLGGLLALVSTVGERTPQGGPRLAAGLLTACAVLALAALARAVPGRPPLRGTLLAAAAGMSFGMASVLTKAVTMDGPGHPVQESATLAAAVLLAVGGLLLSQASFRGTGLALPLATATAVNPVVAAVAGVVLFGETFRHGLLGGLLALLCATVAATGLIRLITAGTGPGTGPARQAPAALGEPTGKGPRMRTAAQMPTAHSAAGDDELVPSRAASGENGGIGAGDRPGPGSSDA